MFFLSPAHEGGHYTAEIAPIDVKAKKGKVPMAQDEHPRPQTTLEQMAKLAPVFKKGGTVTAANASVSPHCYVLTLQFNFYYSIDLLTESLNGHLPTMENASLC